MTPVLIGLTGRAGSGKDTVAEIIRELVPDAETYALAGPLKDMALAVDPIVDSDSRDYGATISHVRLSDLVGEFGWDEAKREPEVRRFLQRLGTEGVRGTFGPDAWVQLALDWWDNSTAPLGVITDVRFVSEAVICEHVVEVVRPGTELDGENGQHASEKGVPATWVIPNDGTLDQLRYEVRELVEWVLQP